MIDHGCEISVYMQVCLRIESNAIGANGNASELDVEGHKSVQSIGKNKIGQRTLPYIMQYVMDIFHGNRAGHRHILRCQ